MLGIDGFDPGQVSTDDMRRAIRDSWSSVI
jgi:hypothetical protein